MFSFCCLLNSVAFSSRAFQVFDYMPDQQEIHKVAKARICNVCATVLGGIFSGWVKNQIEARNEAVKESKNLMIAMDQEIAEAFRASTKVSGKSRSASSYKSTYDICSDQGRLCEPDAGWLEAETHQAADR